MDQRSSKGKKKKEHDFAVTAFRVVQEATTKPEAKPKGRKAITKKAADKA